MAKPKLKKKLRNKITFIVMLIILVLCVAFFVAQYLGVDFSWLTGGARESKPVTEGTLEIHMIDVGQGDCILVRAPEGNMLIDAGDRDESVEEAIKTYLDDLGIKEFEYVVFTHSDADHIGAADFVMENYAVDNVIKTEEDEKTTKTYEAMMTAIEKSGADLIDAVPGNTYSIGEMEFTILAPIGDSYTDTNDYSVVLRIDFGESSFLMTGDAEKKSEADMVKRYTAYDLDCDVLKVGHHGSRTSSSAELLALVTPEAALISCGEGNSYDHPHGEVMDRLEDYVGNKIYRTDLLGDIVLITDGEKIKLGDAVIVDESDGQSGGSPEVYG